MTRPNNNNKTPFAIEKYLFIQAASTIACRQAFSYISRKNKHKPAVSSECCHRDPQTSPTWLSIGEIFDCNGYDVIFVGVWP